MANFTSIITLEEFTAYMQENILPGDDKNLDLKGNLITACVKAIENYTGLLMQSANFTDTFDGDGGRGFFLPRRPVNSITSITVTGTVLASTEYFLKDNISYVKFRDLTTEGWRNYVIAYNAGYGYTDAATANNVPVDIRLACKLWTAYAYRKATTRRHGVSSETASDQSTTYFEKGIPADVEEMLKPYLLLVNRTI